jgi:hypothetical protein
MVADDSRSRLDALVRQPPGAGNHVTGLASLPRGLKTPGKAWLTDQWAHPSRDHVPTLSLYLLRVDLGIWRADVGVWANAFAHKLRAVRLQFDSTSCASA